jgi:uncharacterized membrane protein YqhA
VTRAVRRLLASSRYFIVVAVVGSFAAAAAALVYGGLSTVRVVLQAFGAGVFDEKGSKLLAVELVTIIDLFLLGTVFYIISVGLYELLVDPGLPMPAWLRISTLDDLNERLLGVVAVLLAVTFLGSAVTWDGNPNILALGLAVGAVLGVVSLTVALLARAHAVQAPPAPAAPPPPSAASGDRPGPTDDAGPPALRPGRGEGPTA